MKLLITGGAGFIGSALVRLAISRGHTVINLDSLTYASSLKSVSSVTNHGNYVFEELDIRDRIGLDAVLTKHSPDAILHLAAESHVDRSIDDPSEFIDVNIIGTFNLLEAARDYWNNKGRPSTFKFLHVSTDEVFGSLPLDPNIRFSENTAYDPRSPYSASKASSDHLVRAWQATYGLPTLLSNCSNNYGPYQFPEKLIPVTVLNALAGNNLQIYGDGTNIRDWLYVDDHANALLLVLEKGRIGRSYNIGGENEWTNLDLVEKICSILDNLKPRSDGSYKELIEFVIDRPGHDLRYAIDANRIRDELGWQPTVKIDEGLEQTIRWYLDNEDWWRPLLMRSGTIERLGIL